MTTKQIALLPNSCFGGNLDDMSPAQIKAIELKTTGKNPSDFLENERFLKHMTEKQLKVAGGNDYTQCSRITAARLPIISKATLAKFDHRCLQAINLGGVPLDAKVLSHLNPDALSLLGDKARLPNFLRLSSRFLQSLDKKNTDDQCGNLDLRLISPVHAGGISKTCFRHALENMDAAQLKDVNHLFFLGAAKDIFADIKDADLIAKLKDIEDVWSSLQKDHYADILKLGSDVCEHIKFGDKARKFTYAADLDAECFAKMSEETQKWVLEHHGMIVKEDILSKVDGSRRNSGGAYLEDVIKHFALARPQLLKHFGVGEASNAENVCSTYDILKLKDPKELKRAGRYFPVNCLKSMQMVAADDAIQFTELSLYPKALLDLLDMSAVIENLSDDSLRNMDEVKWKAFIGPKTCGALTHEKFSHVNHDVAFTHLTAACLDEFTFLDKFERSEVRSIPAKVLGAAKADTIGKLDAAHFEVDQVKALGTNASGLGDEAFAKFENEQIAALSATAIASLPVGAFSTITGEKWKHVHPDSLVSIKHTQLVAIPEGILLQTTEKQAAKIPVDAVAAFDKCRDKLPQQVADALPKKPVTK